MGRISVSSDWEATSEAVVEVDEDDEGYAIGENWDGGLRASGASRSLGGCLGRREATDIARNRGRRRDGGDQFTMYLYLTGDQTCTCNPGFQIFSRIEPHTDTHTIC